MNRIIRRAPGKTNRRCGSRHRRCPLLAGCFNGFGAQTSNQPPSGDGPAPRWATSRSAVRSGFVTPSPTSFVLSALFVNTGSDPDALTSIYDGHQGHGNDHRRNDQPRQVQRIACRVQERPVGQPHGSRCSAVGIHPDNLHVRKRWIRDRSVMVVPNEGIYAGVIPGASVSPIPEGDSNFKRIAKGNRDRVEVRERVSDRKAVVAVPIELVTQPRTVSR